ncbi:hypothetical protein GCM10009101_03830 [Brevundimonas lenta]
MATRVSPGNSDAEFLRTIAVCHHIAGEKHLPEQWPRAPLHHSTRHVQGSPDNAPMTNNDPKPRTRLSDETWAEAREDYLAGVSTGVIAERYGLTDRSVRRRAAQEGWRREARPRQRYRNLGDRIDNEIEALPELTDILDVNNQDMHDLLFLPDGVNMCRFAFRRAAEAAALDSPNEAAAWMRLVHLTVRVRTQIDVDVRPFSRADYLRAGMLRSVGDHLETNPFGLGTESDMSGKSAEIHGGPDSDG